MCSSQDKNLSGPDSCSTSANRPGATSRPWHLCPCGFQPWSTVLLARPLLQDLSLRPISPTSLQPCFQHLKSLCSGSVPSPNWGEAFAAPMTLPARTHVQNLPAKPAYMSTNWSPCREIPLNRSGNLLFGCDALTMCAGSEGSTLGFCCQQKSQDIQCGPAD